MTVEILCVGNELLSGITLNTNAHWLAGEVAKAGGTVRRVTVVGDDVGEISTAIKESLARKPGVLVTTGGLGATYDDMTLEGVARALGRKAAVDRRAAEMLRESYARRRLPYRLNKVRLKMATIPEGSTPIPNMVGSAPAVHLDAKGTRIFCLQGVPAEMKAIFSEHVLPVVREGAGGTFVAMEVNYDARGVSEAMIAPMLLKIVRANPKHSLYLKTHPRGYVSGGRTPRIRVQIISRGHDVSRVEKRLGRIARAIESEVARLGGRIRRL